MGSGYQCGLTARHRHGCRCRRPEADALNEMDQAGAFTDVELDDASLEALLSSGGAIGQYHQGGC